MAKKPSASPNNKAAKRYLKELLRIVDEHPVRDVEYDREADIFAVPLNYYIEHVPSGRQTHTIKVVVNVHEADS